MKIQNPIDQIKTFIKPKVEKKNKFFNLKKEDESFNEPLSKEKIELLDFVKKNRELFKDFEDDRITRIKRKPYIYYGFKTIFKHIWI